MAAQHCGGTYTYTTEHTLKNGSDGKVHHNLKKKKVTGVFRGSQSIDTRGEQSTTTSTLVLQ